MSKIQNDLPTTRQLLKATAIAVAVASGILVTIILPAEYGVDPTGIGNKLGLGVLAATQAPMPTNPSKTPSEPELDAVGQPLKPVQASLLSKQTGVYHQDTMTVLLAPGKGAEIKAPMKDGDSMVFHWIASAPVAFDMHGERIGAADGEYTSYWIEPSKKEASGTFTASFDGVHGWYWLNRSQLPITVQVEVAGFQDKLYRP